MVMDVPDLYLKKALVLGCGNVLFGDDGFGVEVARYINENYAVPSDVEVLDVGTGVRSILFNMILYEGGPEKIIVVDSVDKGRRPGEVFKISLEDIPLNKKDDFSMHETPSSNMLKELQDFCDMEVIVLVCQVKHIPTEVEMGLTPEVKSAVPVASKMVMELLIER